MQSFQLDPQKAREGDRQSSRITESGAYIGIITLAKHITASTGSQGIELSFKSVDGQEASYLSMYTQNASGQPIFGEKQLNAFMCCMKVRAINQHQTTIDEYDFESKKTTKVQANVYPEIMNKPIGLVLQSEEYEANDGSIKSRMQLAGFFNAESKQTANEVLDSKPAKNLDARLAALKDKKINTGQQSMNQQNNIQLNNQSVNQSTSAPDFDDDIPF